MSSFESADIAEVKVALGGGVLATVKTFTPADSDDQYHFYDIDLSAYALPATTVKVIFDAGMSASDDLWYIDDVVLTGLK